MDGRTDRQTERQTDTWEGHTCREKTQPLLRVQLQEQWQPFFNFIFSPQQHQRIYVPHLAVYSLSLSFFLSLFITLTANAVFLFLLWIPSKVIAIARILLYSKYQVYTSTSFSLIIRNEIKPIIAAEKNSYTTIKLNLTWLGLAAKLVSLAAACIELLRLSLIHI